MAQTEALDIVTQQLLKSEYGLYGVHVSELRSDAKGVLGLQTACKPLTHKICLQTLLLLYHH